MNGRIPITVDIYRLLLELTKEKLIGTHKYKSVAQLIQEESTHFINETTSVLLYNPTRLDDLRMKQILCDELYPRKKTVISVHKDLFFVYKDTLSSRVVDIFSLNSEDINLSNRYVIEIILWFALQRHGINIDSPYFDDDRLLEELDIENLILQSLLRVASISGDSPTSREYEKLRKELGGPSLSFIKNVFGTFNKAKEKAGLKAWDGANRKKYI